MVYIETKKSEAVEYFWFFWELIMHIFISIEIITSGLTYFKILNHLHNLKSYHLKYSNSTLKL